MTKKIKMSIWGREFELPVHFDESDSLFTTQKLNGTMKEFCNHKEWLDNAKKVVEDYCKEKVMEDEENQKKDNIFSYIIPEYFFVKMSKEQPKVAMVCRYRYDPEHGLMIIFDENGIPVVGGQDMPY